MNTKYLNWVLIIISTSVIFSVSGCKRDGDTPQVYMEPEAVSFDKAVAIIHPLNNSDVTGIVYFNQLKNGIEIIADIEGLEPGKHGFHIHEFGDLRKEDGTSAGGHFNPEDKPHGAPDSDNRHVGDLGNIVAIPNESAAHYTRTDTTIAFTGKHSIIGRAVIIHQGEDDYVTQPTGNAGPRVGGGVIGIANDNVQ
jgi:Cu-Zn family superoxide dismutase